MHALCIACIYQIYIVFKEYGECYSSKERRGSLFIAPSVSILFLPIISCLKRQKGHFCVLGISDLWNSRGGWWNWPNTFNFMGTKMKGIYKAGFKYITNIFVVKERELEIGYPTDVKHVAHIGWEGSSGSAPTWMKGFKTGPEFAATTIGNNGSSLSPWSSQESKKGAQKGDEVSKKDTNSGELSKIPKPKQKRKKSRSNSSPKSGSSSSSSSRASRSSAKSKSKFIDVGNNKPIKIEAKPTINIEVA